MNVSVFCLSPVYITHSTISDFFVKDLESYLHDVVEKP